MIGFRTRTKTLTLCLAAALVGVTDLPGHGGRYRGAPSVVNPPQPPPESSPAPAPKPYTPPPIHPPRSFVPGGGPTRGPTTPRGVSLALPDFSRWQVWWEMNKDQYVLVKQAIRDRGPVTGDDEYYLGATRRRAIADSSLPGERLARDRILPALHTSLRATNNPDLVTSCLLGMAKIGRDHPSFELLSVINSYLPSKHQEIRETAALALGVTRRVAALPTLRDLLLDTAVGRRLARRAQVDNRMRAFAAYGLGILAAHGDADTRRQAFTALHEVLRDKKVVDRDIQVAVISAMGVMRPDPTKNSKDKRLLWQALPVLFDRYEADRGVADQIVQAHVPVAIGRLLGRGDSADQSRYRAVFAAELAGTKRRHSAVRQSAAIALGLLAAPEHKAESDGLYRYFQTGRDQQARYLSLIAMGEIGGAANRTRLLKVLTKGKKALERPWAALALGVSTYRERTGKRGIVDETVGRALERQLISVKNKASVGAFAIGLGLCGHADAAPRMRDLLESSRHHDELAGYLSIGLALMRDRKAIGLIRSVMHGSVRRPHLLRLTAIALGKLGDRQAVPYLLELLGSDYNSTARMASVAGALQFIGDRRTVDTLVKMLADDELTKLARAFVAAALGGIADPMVLPFGARYAMDCNYRAAASTLTDQANGILDLL